MCGIYATNYPLEEEEVRKRLDSIDYRGPDFTGVVKKEQLTLGHLRLSILDLEPRSHQPMTIDDYTIVFNGEIYNYQDIREELVDNGVVFKTSGDTEVLLRGYVFWGENIVSKLNGMFAFVIYDRKKNTLFCSRDRLGVKPFYYSWCDGKFEICSQLSPISEGKVINDKAISMYLDCRYIPSPYSVYRDVFKLSPGHNLLIDLEENTHEISKYWDLSKVKEADLSFEEAKSKLHTLIKDSTRIRLNSDVPFGSFLSGGVDSALVSSIAQVISDEQINTFTVGFEDSNYDESNIAKKFSELIGSKQTVIDCKPKDLLQLLPELVKVYDEPFGDSSALPSLLLNRLAKNHVTVALSGDGGDESFLGYNHFDFIMKYRLLFKIPFFLRKLLAKSLGLMKYSIKRNSIQRVLGLRNLNDFIEGVFIGYNSLLKERDLGWFKTYSGYRDKSNVLLQQAADLNIKLWLENDSNVKVDRASMASSIEVRSPFLDYRIIEFARTLPVKYRRRGNRKKYILREILKEYIPEEVFNQPKKGFSIPIAQWIREDLREEFSEVLSISFLSTIPNFDVGKFNNMFKNHLEGKENYSSHIWRVYILAKWCDYNNIQLNK
jgi:asparagine synthase (glutamine-hydrolysing)